MSFDAPSTHCTEPRAVAMRACMIGFLTTCGDAPDNLRHLSMGPRRRGSVLKVFPPPSGGGPTGPQMIFDFCFLECGPPVGLFAMNTQRKPQVCKHLNIALVFVWHLAPQLSPCLFNPFLHNPLLLFTNHIQQAEAPVGVWWLIVCLGFIHPWWLRLKKVAPKWHLGELNQRLKPA